MLSLLKFVAIVILSIYVLGFLLRLLLRLYFRRMTRPFDPPRKRPEGDVTIEKPPSRKEEGKSKRGEYVDYEEI